MVEYDARMTLALREHEPADTTQQMTVHFGSHIASPLGGHLDTSVVDWDAESTGEMILAWGETSLDNPISVSFSGSAQHGVTESDSFDWSLCAEPVVPRPRPGDPRSANEQHDPSRP